MPPLPTIVPASNTLADWMPINCIPIVPKIAPALLTPPEKWAILRNSMPAEPAEIVPALLMPPEKVEPFSTSTPVFAAPIVPPLRLVMPPESVKTLSTTTPAKLVDEITPLLWMPPNKVETLSRKIELPVARITPMFSIAATPGPPPGPPRSSGPNLPVF